MTQPNLIAAPPDPGSAVLLPSGQWLIPNTTVPSRVWVITFGPYGQDRYLDRMTLNPPDTMPVLNPFVVWRENTAVARARDGSSTLWTPTRPIPVKNGMRIYAVWYWDQGTTPTATLETLQTDWGYLQ